jgi:glycosyltransferase involved in cell wall biosynthesis
MPARPDILMVGFVGGLGGASSLIRDLAVGYAARGITTRVVVPDWATTTPFVASLRDRGLDATTSAQLNLNGGRLSCLVDAMRAVASFRAPIVHYHLSDNYLAPPFIRAMDLLRPAPSFVSMHSPFNDPLPGDGLARRWAQAARRHVKRVICVSEDSRARQIEYGVPAALTTVIYNGVDLPRFSAGDAAAARSALPSVPRSSPLIVSTARIDHQKQPLAAVAAFARIATGFPDAHLVMVGDGPLEQETRAAAAAAGLSARVHLVGHRPNVQDWLAAAAVWLLPTLTEGFSIGLLEAMAAGCLVVTTLCPGNNEILRDSVNALAVPVGDLDATAAALRRSLTNPSLRDQLAPQARATAARFSLDVTIEQHLACYGIAGRSVDAAPRMPDVG